MINVKRLTVFIMVVSLLYSCAPAWVGFGAGIGIGAYKYIEGNLERDYPLAYEKAWDVTNEALANLQISITESLKEEAEGRIEAVRRDGKAVIVKLKDKGQGVTSIGIRIGVFGDRVASEKIHEEIARVAGLR
jgi:hypothetical protein